MNLLLLVEGERIEPVVYREWLSHLFPYLNFVSRPEDLVGNSCRIIPGYGYPNMVSTPKSYAGFSRLEACLRDIKNYNNVDYFLICVDSEEETYQSRFNEISLKLDSLKLQLNIDASQLTQFFIIIQTCCIETWALGNAQIPSQYSVKDTRTLFPLFQQYYDVLNNDPELMACCPPDHSFSTKARFNKKYLKEYLKHFGLSFNNKNPQIIAEKKYLNALINRCSSTSHLDSFKYLLSILEYIKDVQESAQISSS